MGGVAVAHLIVKNDGRAGAGLCIEPTSQRKKIGPSCMGRWEGNEKGDVLGTCKQCPRFCAFDIST